MHSHFEEPMNQTKQIVELLTKAVADTYALYLVTLHCHWNMEDPRFMFLHEMLQSQYEQLAENGDLLAERIRQMGAKIPGSLQEFARHSKIKEISVDASADEMIAHLTGCHEMAIIGLKELSEKGEDAKDYGLVDLLGSVLRDHEKAAWILRSHLSAKHRAHR